MAVKKNKKSSSKNRAGGSKGHIPTEILEERLQKLNRKVKARGGKHF